MSAAFDPKTLRVEVFANDQLTVVRVTHTPTGLCASATRSSQRQAQREALQALAELVAASG